MPSGSSGGSFTEASRSTRVAVKQLSQHQYTMSPVAAVLLKRSEVPSYLQESERFQYLSSNNDEISVPATWAKADTSIRSVHDLEHLLLTMRYWMVSCIPKEVIAAWLHNQQLFQKFLPNEYMDDVSCMGYIMVHRGQLECLQFLVQCGMVVDKGLCVHAANNSQLLCLKYLIVEFVKRGGVVTADIWKSAINNGESSASCLVYLLTAFPAAKSKMELINWACRADRLNCVRVLRDHRCKVDVGAVMAAAEGGSLACLQYLHEEFGYRCWVPSLDLTASNKGNKDSDGLGKKQLELLQLLHEIGTAWDASALVAALQLQLYKPQHETTTSVATGSNHVSLAPRE